MYIRKTNRTRTPKGNRVIKQTKDCVWVDVSTEKHSNAVMKISPDDWNKIKAFTRNRWRACNLDGGNRLYCVSTDNDANKLHLAHRVIMGDPEGLVIDHINPAETLNNLRYNLRSVTYSQNSQNQRLRVDNKSGIKGVSIRNGKYIARIGVNGKRYHIGTYNTLEEAIDARKMAEVEYFEI